MADTLTAAMEASFTWAYTDALASTVSTISDSGSLSYSKSWSDGIGDNAADILWHTQDTLAAAATKTWNIMDEGATATTNSIFSSTITIDFAKVKGIIIVNKNTVSGDDFIWDATSGNTFSGPFGGATGKVVIPADSVYMTCDCFQGWTPVATTGDEIKLTSIEASNTITYQIAIFGTSV